LERDPRARELAIADNRVAELDLDWDPATLEALSREINLTKFWTAEELEGLLARIPDGKIEEPEAPAPVLHVCPKCGHKFR
jgi:rubrerythrin